jgi:hypothetical protein
MFHTKVCVHCCTNVNGVNKYNRPTKFPYLDLVGPKNPFLTLTRIKKFWEPSFKKRLRVQDLL